ncbi:MAG: endonuclease [Pseudonocardiales bacterium]|nr:MAG: endonuclease [Pseudonocardiales bacterium]
MSEPATLRVMTYNVRSLRDDAAAVSRVIREAQPHVVCVQEAPRFLRWRSRAAALARTSGLLVIAGGRGAAGNLLLCSLAVEVTHRAEVLLSHRPKTHPRGVVVAVCSLRGHRFALAGTHLDLAAAERRLHADELLDALPRSGVGADIPVILAGDFNEQREEPARRRIAAALTDTADDTPTYPAKNPVRRIDSIYADPRLRFVRSWVVGTADVMLASDHRPVVAEIDLEDRTS